MKPDPSKGMEVFADADFSENWDKNDTKIKIRLGQGMGISSNTWDAQ